MPSTIVIDPVTRIEGHLKVTVTVDVVSGEQQVVDAWISGTLFRGIENILLDRHPWDAQHITQRICGVCPVPHSMASVLALQQASGVTPPANATLLRNLVLAANFLDSHILHFYQLCAPDYVDGPAMPPWQPAWQSDKRIDPAVAAQLISSYATALDVRRKAHEMGALFGGRMPHPPVYLPGGITVTPRRDRIAKFRQYMAEVTSFIDGPYASDVQTIAATYSDFFSLGRGRGNLLSFGVFGSGPRGDTDPLLKRGQVLAAATAIDTTNARAIAEQVTCSWYDESTQNQKPATAATIPLCPKPQAYSWIKAPRYNGHPYEVGPLARMWISGDYQRGVSVMDRHLARAQEASKLTKAMAIWLDQLDTSGPVHAACSVPQAATGEGLKHGKCGFQVERAPRPHARRGSRGLAMGGRGQARRGSRGLAMGGRGQALGDHLRRWDAAVCRHDQARRALDCARRHGWFDRSRRPCLHRSRGRGARAARPGDARGGSGPFGQHRPVFARACGKPEVAPRRGCFRAVRGVRRQAVRGVRRQAVRGVRRQAVRGVRRPHRVWCCLRRVHGRYGLGGCCDDLGRAVHPACCVLRSPSAAARERNAACGAPSGQGPDPYPRPGRCDDRGRADRARSTCGGPCDGGPRDGDSTSSPCCRAGPCSQPACADSGRLLGRSPLVPPRVRAATSAWNAATLRGRVQHQTSRTTAPPLALPTRPATARHRGSRFRLRVGTRQGA